MMYTELCVLLHVLWILKNFFYKPRDQKISDKLRINHYSHAEKSQFLNYSIRQSLKCRHACMYCLDYSFPYLASSFISVFNSATTGTIVEEASDICILQEAIISYKVDRFGVPFNVNMFFYKAKTQ